LDTSPRSEIDAALEELLRAATPALIEQGQTPHSVFELVKKTFVFAAARDSQMKTGRINHSKVAARTGLTRTEVRRLLTAASTHQRKTSIGMDRSVRVVAGWRSDRRFQNEQGMPRTLRISGGTGSFADLVRLHSGDIPVRALLAQLLAKGLARRIGDTVVLRKHPAETKRLDPNAFIDGSPYAAAILGAVAKTDAALTYAHRIELPVADKFQEVLITKKVVQGLSSTAAALDAVSRNSKDKETSRLLKVTLVLTSEPENTANRRERTAARPLRATRKR
jgi:hypothetical protein